MDEMIHQALFGFGREVPVLVIQAKDPEPALVLGRDQGRRPGRLNLVLQANVMVTVPQRVSEHVFADHHRIAVGAGPAAAGLGAGP